MTANTDSVLLELRNVGKSFGGLHAVRNVSMQVRPASIHALIGPNGAGKTTTFNLVNGILPVSSGKVIFQGVDITGWPVHKLAAAGIARTFQTPQLFDDMTVLETVMCGCHLRGTLGPVRSMFAMRRKQHEEKAILDRAVRLLERVGLDEFMDEKAANLSYGHRRVLEVARALGTDPKLLMLDEVAAGLNPTETQYIAGLIRQFVAEGMAVLLVEHDMPFVMGISDKVTVLNFGEVLAEGLPQEVAANPSVIQAYIGSWEE
ncbi:ABC transporter ATP-binding protein [Parapusillimonas sp. SGNA-6]|nr:ABC transporter ATP-binding protein [Parapusillimonas sp. SGNA-6]